MAWYLIKRRDNFALSSTSYCYRSEPCCHPEKGIFNAPCFALHKLVLEMEWYVEAWVLLYGSLFLELCLSTGSVLFLHKGRTVNQQVSGS
jgi:hypothetical protein